MKKIVSLAALIALSLFCTDSGFSQTSKELSELRREIEALKAGQLAIQKDLAEIKNLILQRELQTIKEMLQGRQAPTAAPAQAQAPAPSPEIVLSIDGAAVKGDKNAKVTLVEFTDYQCPFCSRHYRDTLPQIENDYIKTGKIRYVLKEFPLESIHPLAFKAHEAANCSGEQGKYWEMHDKIFDNQRAMTPKDLTEHAKTLALDTAKFQQCFDGGKYAAKVRKDLNDAQKAGVTGTPTFFLGLTDSKGSEVRSVRKLVGAQPYATFKDAIDTLLATK